MKRILAIALAATAFGAGVANAQYDPYWDVNKANRAQGTAVEQNAAQRQNQNGQHRFHAAPIEQQTNYGPA